MKVHLSTEEPLPVVRVAGNMRLEGSQVRMDRLVSTVLTAFQQNSKVILDLSEVTDIDSQGIGCIARCLASAISHKAELRIFVPPGNVRRALAQVNLLSVFKNYETDPLKR